MLQLLIIVRDLRQCVMSKGIRLLQVNARNNIIIIIIIMFRRIMIFIMITIIIVTNSLIQIII